MLNEEQMFHYTSLGLAFMTLFNEAANLGRDGSIDLSSISRKELEDTLVGIGSLADGLLGFMAESLLISREELLQSLGLAAANRLV